MCIVESVDLVSRSDENLLRIRGLLDEIIKERLKEIPNWVKRKDLMEEIMNEVLGLGVLEEYLKDPMVSEVMINGSDVYYERDGRIFDAPRGFASPDEVRQIIENDPPHRKAGGRIESSGGRQAAGRVPGEHRRAAHRPGRAGHYDSEVFPFDLLCGCVDREPEHLPADGRVFRTHGGAPVERDDHRPYEFGKTTLLNLISNFIPSGERIVTIEEMAELQLLQRHVVRLETRAPNVQGKGEITVRTLFRNALHMRPDRIIVGECRGAETLDMLQAMNTGHDGSISTAHSNSPRDLFSRLEAMIAMSDLPLNSRTVRKQIASGIDVVAIARVIRTARERSRASVRSRREKRGARRSSCARSIGSIG